MSKKPLILVVDDDPLMRDNISKIIEKSDRYDHLLATSGKEALDLMTKKRRWMGYGKHPVSCIILDIKMPDMNGLLFLQSWRKLEKMSRVPIILLSAYEDQDKWKQATDINSGLVTTYLKKPVESKALLDTLYRITEKKEAEDMTDETRAIGYEKQS